MAIENRTLESGTELSALYKGKRYGCTVEEVDGAQVYRLEDGTTHKSLSAAGSKLMDGKAVNGWRFWSLASDMKDKPVRAPKRTKPAAPPERPTAGRSTKVIKHVPNQKGVPEGSKKWWCSACMKAFVVEGLATPGACPEGHAAEATDELSVE